MGQEANGQARAHVEVSAERALRDGCGAADGMVRAAAAVLDALSSRMAMLKADIDRSAALTDALRRDRDAEARVAERLRGAVADQSADQNRLAMRVAELEGQIKARAAIEDQLRGQLGEKRDRSTIRRLKREART